MKNKVQIRLLVSLSLLLALAMQMSIALAAIGDTTRVSVDSSGGQANGSSFLPSVSADGRYVAFYSDASNLVSGDTNGEQDVFVHDRQTNTTTRVSVDSSGAQGNGFSYLPSISADGRFVAFSSNASNLVSGDTNNSQDMFVRDMQANTTTLISLASDGTQGDNASYNPSISADGRFVAFSSDATDLVSGDTNGTTDIFVHNMQTNTTRRVSVDSSGAQGNGYSNWASSSADGRYVAFFSGANNLVSDDTNDRTDIFVYDCQTNTITRVSLNSFGEQGNGWSYFPSISSDGRYIAFLSWANNLVDDDTNNVGDIFVRDTQTNLTTRVSLASDGTQGDNASEYAAISADGNYVTFDSYASNLVSGDTNGAKDVFIRDVRTNTTQRASLASDGTQGNIASYSPSISSDGRFVVFESDASNLVGGDTNSNKDIFVHEYTTVSDANIDVRVGGVLLGNYILPIGQSIHLSYRAINNGPVTITSTNHVPIIAAEQYIWKVKGQSTSYAAMMGLPADQLTSSYVFPWYNNRTMDTQLRIGNMGSSAATITVKIGSSVVDAFPLAPNVSVRKSYALNNGPMEVSSSKGVPIIVSEQHAWKGKGLSNSYAEMMGLPASQLATSYVFPWYNNRTMNTQLNIGNMGSSATTVTIKIGGSVVGTFLLAPNVSVHKSYTLNNGPVTITSTNDVPIIASEQYTLKVKGVSISYAEMMGLPANQLTTSYVLPWYDNRSMSTQLRIGNMGSNTTTVTINMGGSVVDTFILSPRVSSQRSYALNTGPVNITSTNDVPIVISEFYVWKVKGLSTRYTEMLGLPASQLTTSYVFPWYNNQIMDTQLIIGVP